jgi:hypothetical protein
MLTIFITSLIITNSLQETNKSMRAETLIEEAIAIADSLSKTEWPYF